MIEYNETKRALEETIRLCKLLLVEINLLEAQEDDYKPGPDLDAMEFDPRN